MKRYRLNEQNSKKYFDRVCSNAQLIAGSKKEDILKAYVDPDLRIEEEFLINGKRMKLSPDGICGIHYLLRYYEGDDIQKAYTLMRNKMLLWPKHPQSINQRRYAYFRDRIDFTLYDIKRFFDDGGSTSKLIRKNSAAAEYLQTFADFSDFAQEYELLDFVEDTEIINLETGEPITGYEQYMFSEESNKKYLSSLLAKLENPSPSARENVAP